MTTRKAAPAVLIFSAALILSASSGCKKLENLSSKMKPVQPPKGTIIAKVDSLFVTAEQLEQEIENYNQLIDNPAGKITTREQKLAYLNDELIRRYLFYLEAKEKRMDERPQTQEILRTLEINVLANQLIQDEIGNMTVTSSEVEDFYKIYKDQYQQAEERKVREIAVDSEQEAKDALVQLLQGADFPGVAVQRSRAESAAKGGDLGFIKRGDRGPDFAAFDEVAFSRSLAAGQISNIFKLKDKYYIIKVEAVRGGQARPLSEVWDEINRTVLFLKQQQKLQEISANLSKKNKVTIYDDKIK
ncbi:MAG: peptidyl-prolyl cis-trans isomerase [Candidatus Omnitrophica bacterium]|nr:peptidyl-prolyl cis-trans isomerase [Candidatus Omnitrophota bacterium]MDD5552532.1 peptidyl-prolyl cis-trans isomerase [Candidatus Omnitrophota bacterium]